MSYKIRRAQASDMPAVWTLIQELAVYEKAPDAVKTTPETMARDGFGAQPLFECIVIETAERQIVGTAIFYFGYSTWKGKMIYLDDLVVTQTQRRQGLGQRLMDWLLAYGWQHNVKQIRWHVLDWNQPAIEFYQKLNAELDSEWIKCTVQPPASS